jgi:hypothetical protein
MTMNRRNAMRLDVRLLLIPLLMTTEAMAGDYRAILGLGIGGAGIKRNSSLTSSVPGQVTRSEGFGTFEVAIERILSDRFTMALTHARGFRLGPFSSGVGFTGLFGRYYFFQQTWGAGEAGSETTLLVRRILPYLGVGLGLASGTIERAPPDLVTSLSASALFVGVKLGADLPLSPKGFGVRAELGSSFTGTTTGPEPSSLSYFSVGSAVFFHF